MQPVLGKANQAFLLFLVVFQIGLWNIQAVGKLRIQIPIFKRFGVQNGGKTIHDSFDVSVNDLKLTLIPDFKVFCHSFLMLLRNKSSVHHVRTFVVAVIVVHSGSSGKAIVVAVHLGFSSPAAELLIGGCFYKFVSIGGSIRNF